MKEYTLEELKDVEVPKEWTLPPEQRTPQLTPEEIAQLPRAEEQIPTPTEKTLVPQDQTQLPTPEQTDRSEFGKGWSRGVDKLGALAKGAGGALASLARSIVPDAIEPEFLKTAEEAGLAGYTEEMKAVEEDKNLQAAVPGIEDIRLTEEGGLSRLGDWAASQLGEGLPMILSSVVGGGVGAVAGKALVSTGVKAVAKGAMEKVVAGQAAKEAAALTGEELAALSATNTAVTTGATLGAGAVSLGMETGGIFGDIFERTGEKDPLTSLAFGTIAASLDTLTPMRVLKGLGVGNLAKKGIGETIAKDSTLWGRLLKELPKAAATEGVTEGLQELIEEAAVQWVDKDAKFLDFSKEKYMEALNAAAAGALLGAVASPLSAGGGVSKATGKTETKDLIPPESVLAPVEGQESQEGVPFTQPVVSEDQLVLGTGQGIETQQVPTPTQRTEDILASTPQGQERENPLIPSRSGLEEAISSIKQNKASGNQWLNMLKGKEGVKAEEIADTELEPWLKEQGTVAVSKEKILGFLKENRPKISEVTSGEEQYNKLDSEINSISDELVPLDREINQLLLKRDQEIDENPHEFDKKVEEYKILIDPLLTQRAKLRQRQQYLYRTRDTEADTRYEFEPKLRLPGPSKNYQEISLTLPNAEPFSGEDEIHFGGKTGQKGLSWIRGDERTDVEGKTGFFVDEVQSKRHQEGRRTGYNNPAFLEKERARLLEEENKKAESLVVKERVYDRKRLSSYIDTIEKFYPNSNLEKPVDDFLNRRIDRSALMDAVDTVGSNENPDSDNYMVVSSAKADLVNSAYAVRNSLEGRQSATKAYDVLLPNGMRIDTIMSAENSLSEGEALQQARKNYLEQAGLDIEEKIKERQWTLVPDAPFKKGWPLLTMKRAIAEAAQKGLDRVYWTPGQVQSDRYNGYGDEALKRFYDQELPREVGGYVKKFGGKVFQTQLNTGKGNSQDVWAIDITPELKKEVLEKGATLYSQPENLKGAGAVTHEDATRSVRGSLVSALGEETVGSLERSGLLKYAEDTDGHGYAGAYSKNTGVSTLYPQNVINGKEDPVGVLLHEAGSHATFPTMLGKSFEGIQNSFDKLLSSGSPAALAAQKRAEASALKPEHVQEERIAYFIQEAWGRIQNREDIGQARVLFNRIINAIKAWFRTTEFGKALASRGVDFELTDEYAVALAKRAIDSLATYAQGIQELSEATGDTKASFVGVVGFNQARRTGNLTSAVAEGQKIAYMLTNKKVSPEEVWRQTGWFMDDADQNMKFEVSDAGAKVTIPSDGLKVDNGTAYYLGDVLDHPELYKYYPQLREVAFIISDKLSGRRAYTNIYSDEPSTIVISKDVATQKTVVMHEVQHIIQEIEGFAVGGSARNVNLLSDEDLAKVIRSQAGTNAPSYQRLLNQFIDNRERLLRLHKERARLGRLLETASSPDLVSPTKDILDKIDNQLANYNQSFGHLFYRILHGEAEAREVEFRSTLSDEELKATPPRKFLGGSGVIPETQKFSEDYLPVPPKDTIVVKHPRVSWAEQKKSQEKELVQRASSARLREFNHSEILNEDILASRPLNSAAFLHPVDFILGHDSDELSWFERFRIWMQDAFLVLKEKQEGAANLPANAKAYQRVGAFHNISTERVKGLRSDFQEPVLKIAADNNIPIDVMDKFLYARSAPQANDILERRRAKDMLRQVVIDSNVSSRDANRILGEMKTARTNARAQNAAGKWYIKRRQLQTAYLQILDQNLHLASPELIATITEFRSKPSGMTTADAQTILGNMAQTPYHQALQDIGAKIDEMNRFVVDELVNSQLLSKNQAIAWNNYQHYVMLKRHGYEDTTPGSGRGLSASRASKLRYGSVREARDILTNTFASAEAQIIKAEKNLTALSLAGLVNANPDKNFWSVIKANRAAFLDENGFVSFGDTRFIGDNDVVFWLQGKPNLISFNPANKRAISIARAFNRLDTPKIKGPLLAMRAFNRWLALVNTSLSPEFLLTNLPRDFFTATFNMGASDADLVRKKIYSNYKDSFKALKLLLRTDTTNSTDPLVLDAKRFKEAGGMMDWAESYRTTERHRAALERRIKELTPGTMHYYKRNIASLIEDYNSIGENMTRLAAFRALTASRADGGLAMSDADAVEITNELTVHFSRKGTAGEAINALYLFANAGIQGSAIIMMNIAKSAKVRKYVYSAVALGVIADLVNRALSDEDDRGRNLYDNLPDNVKERNFVFTIPGTGRFLTIPAPWGFNVPWVAGTKIGEMLQKEDFSFAEAGTSMFKTALNAFIPFYSGSVLQSLSPTLLDPYVMIRENIDPFGNPLRPEKFPNQMIADSQLYWSSASTVSRTMAEFLNSVSGGDKVKSGLLDFSPNVVDMWANSLFGALGKQAMLLGSLTEKIATDRADDIELADVPIVRKLLPTTKHSIDPMKYHQNVADVLTLKAQIKEYRRTDPDYVRELLEKNSGLRKMFAMTASTEARLNRLRTLRKNAIRNGDREREKLLDEKIKELQARYNDVFKERVGGS